MKLFSASAHGLLASALLALPALAGPGASYDVHLAIQSRNAYLIQGRGVPMVN
ncbi:MAG: hypothetical protein JSS51_11885, partial [Planctomycetes bacterium]|nr:hypothetical protein [Planctomycetota bacterium]